MISPLADRVALVVGGGADGPPAEGETLAIGNVSSLNALRSGTGIAYESSKAGLLGLAQHVSGTAAPLNIRINTILPGVINSTILRRYMGDHVQDLSARIPLGREGTPWDV